MEVRVNGKPHDAPAGVRTLEGLMAGMRLKPENTLLKLNSRHVPWDRWPDTPVADSDVIEILAFVGGG